jgi:Tfp pilus assembly protein PilF
MNDEFYPIEAAIKAGELAYARECLRDILRLDPSADAWYLAAAVARTPEQRQQCLEKALLLDPDHRQAQLALTQIYQRETQPGTAQSTLPGWLRSFLGAHSQQ